tara:strand:+ start:2692 stop:4365 length:1674 start_codon:yes stop_codon:yes gene_type:complete
MRLRRTLLLFLILTSSVFAFTAYTVSKQVVDSVVQDLVWKYSRVAAQYDVERTLSPILEEVALAKAIAKDPHIISWALNARDEIYKSTAEEALERYRWQFKSKNFFIALDSDLSYHFNDVQSIRQPSYLRYYLEPDSVTDAWYFSQKHQGQALSVNIAKDVHIDRTKVWVNQAITYKGQFLGLVGTGMDIEQFTNQLTHRHFSSLKTLFVDESDRVQIILQSGELDYPLRSSAFEKPVLSSLVPNRHELNVLSQLMRQQKSGQEAELLMIEQEEGRAVVSIHYIEELGWYELTFVNVDSMLSPWIYTNLSYLFIGLSMMFSLLAFYYWCNRWVKPLEKWGQRIETMANESEFTIVGAKGTFEEQLSALERELKESRHSLRQMVASRTAALDELTTVDVVTQLWNRKGLENELSMELARTRREQTSFGLIWIDLGLNDGSELETNSEAFEQVLNKAGKGIGKAIRLYDRASRWEDDEFLVLVRAKHACNLEILAQRIKSCIYSEIDSEQDQIQFPRLSELAIGGAMICPGLTKKDALAMADRALYIAKEQGGDKIYIY